MALVVEDGTGKADAESYGSVADADTYHAKFGNLGWADFTTEEKESSLRRATQYIDATYGRRYPGYQLNQTQALLWPRIWNSYQATPSGGVYIPLPISPALPPQVVTATYEAALRAASAELLADEDAPVASQSVGPISVTYFQGQSRRKTYPLIDRIISQVLGGGMMGTVERA